MRAFTAFFRNSSKSKIVEPNTNGCLLEISNQNKSKKTGYQIGNQNIEFECFYLILLSDKKK